MPTPVLVVFKGPIANARHWAFFLPHDDENNDGKLNDEGSLGHYYGVAKNSFVSMETAFLLLEATDEKVIVKRLELSEINISKLELSNVCLEVCQNRPFNLYGRNCQNFVCEVIERLYEDEGIGTDGIFERMRNEGLVPLNKKMGRKEKK
jgi:hypothetical protein